MTMDPSLGFATSACQPGRRNRREAVTVQHCAMPRPASALIAGSLCLCFASAAQAERLSHPLRFFEGPTEMVSTVKLMTKKPYHGRTTGQGQIQSDGSLVLVQRVEDEGRPPYQRRWHMRPVGSGRFVGTMTEAKGPVTAEEVRGRTASASS